MTPNAAPRPSNKPRPAVKRSGRRSPGLQHLSFAVVPERSTERHELESIISRKFKRDYGAQLTHFLPELLRLRVSEEFGAVLGIQPASKGELFLEQYLDSPIEQSVAGAFRTPVDRDQIVEIGNLTANIPGLAHTLFAVLASVLNEAGYRWVACTATPQVESMLNNSKFPSVTICSADPERLEDGAGDWGDYYGSRPNVIVGDVREAAAQIADNRQLSTLIGHLAQAITRMATSLRVANS